ncbi:MAG: hypothetical protein R3F49_05595 [Planctomycetota bacterium]
MRHSTLTAGASLALTLTASFLLLLSGCASDGGKRPANRSLDLTGRLTEQYQALSGSLDGAVQALSTLRGTVERQGIIQRQSVAVGDVEGAFKGLKASLAGLRKATASVESAQAGLGNSFNAYLATWDKEIAGFQSEDLKESAQRRREASDGRFKALTAELSQATPSFERYIGRVAELEKALSLDLTPAGVGALDSVLEDAIDAAKPLREETERLAGLTREFGQTLTAAGAPK